ncbi:9fad7441-ad48-4d53-82a3-a8691fef9ed6-CDS [Sclerotinia trifoliorum]|uniref:9fad7441-ad48-4d53-82a3-a8691fef9ed6-CDS n=1 Tax=Sclerotinia trifoliorum TaxID=28548 RepID=A0A8H2W461_9HELO|nr:9fad7441-ad48-4d53-82a3-a8691fef9ed6-CDS [Sclerotinia trifoliorum]
MYQSHMSLIDLINWYTRVKQWHRHDFLSTDFYRKWESYGLFDLFVPQGEYFHTDWTPSQDWESWSPPSVSPDWYLVVETLARLYFSEERDNKNKRRNPDSLPLTKPDQLNLVVGVSRNQESPRQEFSINDQCYSEGESRANPNSHGGLSSKLATEDRDANKWPWRIDSGPSDNDWATCGEVRGPSTGTTNNCRGGGSPEGGDDSLVPALEKSDLYDHGGRAPQAVADSYQGWGAQSDDGGWT